MIPESVSMPVEADDNAPVGAVRIGDPFVNVPKLPMSPQDGSRGISFDRTCYLFMTEFCGSTLLARLLAASEGVLVLNEPPTFAQQLRTGSCPSPKAVARAISAIRYRGEPWPGTLVVKEQSVSNCAAASICAVPSVNRSAFLYQGLRHHLLASLRVPARLDWKLGVVAAMARARPDLITYEIAEMLAGRNILLRITAEWLLNLRCLAESRAASGDSILAVDRAELMADPVGTANRVAAHFGLSPLPGVPDGILSRHAKDTGRAFDRESESERDAAAARELHPELERCDELARRFLARHPELEFIEHA